MRRLVTILATAAAALLIASPASAFAHDRVHNPALHAVLDGLTLLAVTAPLWTVMLWGRARRGLLLALIAVVQAPVAVIGFVPIVNPWLHVGAVAIVAMLTGISMYYARRAAPAAAQVRSAVGR
jgi:hypothetical protein